MSSHPPLVLVIATSQVVIVAMEENMEVDATAIEHHVAKSTSNMVIVAMNIVKASIEILLPSLCQP